MIRTVVRALALDGTPAGEPLVLAETEYPGRNVALAAYDGAFFAALSPEDGAVRVLELGLDGAIRNEATLTFSDARGASLAVAHDRIAVVVAIGPSEARSLSLLVLDRALRPRSLDRRLTDGAPSALYSTIAPLPDGWLVAWTDEHQPSTSMTLLHVEPDGATREPRFVAHRGDNSGYGGPSIATFGDRAYVALSHEVDGAEPEQTFVQGWRCEPGERDPCAPEDVLPGACAASEPVGWYWIGDDCAPLICPSVCGGTDCDRLAPSRFACLADRYACEPPPACERLEVIDGVCTDSLVVPERALNIIRVERTVECACATDLLCNVHVDAPYELTLEIDACPLAVACDCSPGVVSTDCHMPPLSAGTWTVQPPGLASFPIEVRAPWEMTETVPFCTDWE